MEESTKTMGKGRETKESREERKKVMLGEWQLGKTLGAGSMGKVKLAVGPKGETVAIKIIPRYPVTRKLELKIADADEAPTQSMLDKAVKKDESNELRTVREASILLLLHHPYICGMQSLLVYPESYAMVLEYVSGGQMLDYIIAHGRLPERKARNFARQLTSALDYCHGNNIVHRDLKIENILISKTGNIRLTDFGLSNLYSPKSKLSTFCGSVYFAAPELLSAKIYTGPEVDIWSFGVVLYVLVCGRVPFEDENMPSLHAKIKSGKVHYPEFLTIECKDLLSRIFVIDPIKRATLSEILNHPWLNRGFEGPPDTYFPFREPLNLSDLDLEVIRGMSGFDFGTEEEIMDKLIDVLRSDDYATALQNWQSKRSRHTMSDESLVPGSPPPSSSFSGARSPSKRFSSIDFKKVATFFGKITEPEPKPEPQPTILPATKPETWDPTRGFHPLLSVYYLVQEKMQREVQGSSKFASSSLSLLSNIPPYPPMYPTHPSDMSVPPTPTSPVKPPPSPVMSSARRKSLNMPASPRLSTSDKKESSALSRATSLRETELRRHKQRHSVGPTIQFASSNAGTAVRRTASRGSALPQVDEHGPTATASTPGRHSTWSRHGRAVSVGGEVFANLRENHQGRGRHTSLETTRLPEVSQTAKMSETAADAQPTQAPVQPSDSPNRASTKAKPVYLKGLFSVATTTTKSVPKIKNDLIQVLDHLGVQHREIFSTFECTHVPSIKNAKNDMSVRFEIVVVKVPWLIAIHGLQFRRISGDLWQYHSIARRILQEVKL